MVTKTDDAQGAAPEAGQPRCSLCRSILLVLALSTVGTTVGLVAALYYSDLKLRKRIYDTTASLVALDGLPTAENFQPVEPPRPKPVVSGYEILPAAEAVGRVGGDEFVIGVEIDGHSRAYPLNMLSGPDREIINDELGGRSIVVTWCHLCHTAMVFDRGVNDETLTFVVSMLLWGNNLVMMDLETESLWSQFLGEAMEGPLEGQRLTRISSEVVSLRTWTREHSDTTILFMARSDGAYTEGNAGNIRGGLVLGMVDDDDARAWRFSALREQEVVNDEFGGRPVLVVYDMRNDMAYAYSRMVAGRLLTFALADGRLRDLETGTVWDQRTGLPDNPPPKFASAVLDRMQATVCFDVTWALFHRASTYWDGAKEEVSADPPDLPAEFKQ